MEIGLWLMASLFHTFKKVGPFKLTAGRCSGEIRRLSVFQQCHQICQLLFSCVIVIVNFQRVCTRV